MVLTSALRSIAGKMPYPNLGRPCMKLILAAVNPLVPRRGTRVARIHGCRMVLDCCDRIQRKIYMNLYERNDSRRVQRLLRPGANVLDVGANIGYYTALSANLVGTTGKVLAFEPSPYAYRKLTAMVAANGLAQVECIHQALSDRPGNLTLYIPPAAYGNHDPSIVRYCDSMEPVEVEAVTLDDALARRSNPVIDLMKIDVEGSEIKVLRGAATALRAGRIRHIMCEFNGEMLRGAGSSCRELYDWIVSSGFQPMESYAIAEDLSANLWFQFVKGAVHKA